QEELMKVVTRTGTVAMFVVECLTDNNEEFNPVVKVTLRTVNQARGLYNILQFSSAEELSEMSRLVVQKIRGKEVEVNQNLPTILNDLLDLPEPSALSEVLDKVAEAKKKSKRIDFKEED